MTPVRHQFQRITNIILPYCTNLLSHVFVSDLSCEMLATFQLRCSLWSSLMRRCRFVFKFQIAVWFPFSHSQDRISWFLFSPCQWRLKLLLNCLLKWAFCSLVIHFPFYLHSLLSFTLNSVQLGLPDWRFYLIRAIAKRFTKLWKHSSDYLTSTGLM